MATFLQKLTTSQGVWQKSTTALLKSSMSEVPLNSKARAMKKNPAYAWPKKNKICFHILISPTTRISFLLRLYQKVSGDGRLLHAVEGALSRRAGLEIKQGLHQALAFVRVAASHHEVLLLGVVVVGLLRALCVVNGRGGDADVEVAGVAGVDDVVGVDGLLRKQGAKGRMSKGTGNLG